MSIIFRGFSNTSRNVDCKDYALGWDAHGYMYWRTRVDGIKRFLCKGVEIGGYWIYTDVDAAMLQFAPVPLLTTQHAFFCSNDHSCYIHYMKASHRNILEIQFAPTQDPSRLVLPSKEFFPKRLTSGLYVDCLGIMYALQGIDVFRTLANASPINPNLGLFSWESAMPRYCPDQSEEDQS